MKNKMQKLRKTYLAALLLFALVVSAKLSAAVPASVPTNPVVKTQETASYFDFGKGVQEPTRPGMATAALAGAVLLTIAAVVLVVYIYKKNPDVKVTE